MSVFGKILLGVGVCTLAACGSGSFETNYAPLSSDTSKNWRVASVDVTVPSTLTVTEANSYAPDADIVWRGEPAGDRYAQVDAIITEAATAGAAGLRGSQPVNLLIEVSEFHALTQKTRYGLENAGVHNIAFTAQVVDARSGAPLTPPSPIQADLVAYSGQQAIEAEAEGNTQRVRIVRHVTKVVAGWLGAGPDVRGSFRRRGR